MEMNRLTFQNFDNALSELNAIDRGRYYACTCPSCGEHEAYIQKKTPHFVNCNRKNNCGESTFLQFDNQNMEKYKYVPKTPTQKEEHDLKLITEYFEYNKSVLDLYSVNHFEDIPAIRYLTNRGISPNTIWNSNVDLVITGTIQSMAKNFEYIIDSKFKESWAAERNVVFGFKNPETQMIDRVIARTTNTAAQKKELQFMLKEEGALITQFGNPTGKDVYLTESIIDGLSLLEVKPSAMVFAMTGASGVNYAADYFNRNSSLYENKNLHILLDADKAGYEATERFLKNLTELDAIDLTSKFPKDYDLNGLLQKSGISLENFFYDLSHQVTVTNVDEIDLYYGSMDDITSFSSSQLVTKLDQQTGVYLSGTAKKAEAYLSRRAETQRGYIYSVKAKLGNELSMTDITISKESLYNIVNKLHEQLSFLDMMDSNNIFDIEFLKNSFVDKLLANNSDVDIYNELKLFVRNEVLVQMFETESYTHIRNQDEMIVLNPDNLVVIDRKLQPMVVQENIFETIDTKAASNIREISDELLAEGELTLTDTLSESIAILPDGRMIWGEYYDNIRSLDHNTILGMFGYSNSLASWTKVHDETNLIRYIPESNIAWIKADQVLTEKQLEILEKNNVKIDAYIEADKIVTQQEQEKLANNITKENQSQPKENKVMTLLNKYKETKDYEIAKELYAQLKVGVKEAFNDPDSYLNKLESMSRLHNYSYNNQGLLYAQMAEKNVPMEEMGLINTYKGWQKQGVSVKTGAKAMAVVSPATKKFFEKDNKLIEIDKASAEELQDIKIGKLKEVAATRFRFTNTQFHVRDTTMPVEKIEELTQLKVQPSEKDMQADYDKLRAFVEDKGILIQTRNLDGPKGSLLKVDENDYRILLETKNSLEQNYKTLVHEYAHAHLEHLDKNNTMSKQDKEVQAESVAYIVSNKMGLDTSDYSFNYIASYAQDKSDQVLEKNIQIINDASKKIIKGVEEFDTNIQKTSVDHTPTLQQTQTISGTADHFAPEMEVAT